MEDNLQGTAQQLLNKDGTIKKLDEDIDPRIIRDRYELFIHEYPSNERGSRGGVRGHAHEDYQCWVQKTHHNILGSIIAEDGWKQKTTIW